MNDAPRDKTGPVIPAALPVSATTIARSVDGASVPMPNVLSAKHLDRIAGGLLFAATSNVPWATLLARLVMRDEEDHFLLYHDETLAPRLLEHFREHGEPATGPVARTSSGTFEAAPC